MSAMWRRMIVYGCLIAIRCHAASAINTHIDPDPTKFEDAFGQVVSMPAPPQRIISLSPNLTEILFALGTDRGRIVGVTRFCDYPPEVKGITQVGGIIDPSVETIVSLRPDLVLVTRGNPTPAVEMLAAAHLPVFAVETQGDLSAVVEWMERLRALVRPDDAARGEATVRKARESLRCLREIGGGFPDDRRPSVYYYDPVSPEWTAGRGTHISDAIALAGGRNAGDLSSTAWPRLSLETLLETKPEVLLVAAVDGDTSAEAVGRVLRDLRDRPGWRDLPAVREGWVCIVPSDWLLRPGPRTFAAARRMGACMHPDTRWSCDP